MNSPSLSDIRLRQKNKFCIYKGYINIYLYIIILYINFYIIYKSVDIHFIYIVKYVLYVSMNVWQTKRTKFNFQ